MNSSGHLQDGYLPGWPGRSTQMLTTGGVHLLHFVPGGDQIIPITATYSVTLPAERRFNYLRGENERGGYRGNLQEYYSDYLYEILNEAQTRVAVCLHGDKKGHHQALCDSYFRMLRCVSGRGKKNFTQPENPLS